MTSPFHDPRIWLSLLPREVGLWSQGNRWRKMEKNYVSGFTVFMETYLKEHPEVVEDQQRIWNIYWNPKKVDLDELNSPGNPSRYKQ